MIAIEFPDEQNLITYWFYVVTVQAHALTEQIVSSSQVLVKETNLPVSSVRKYV